MNIMVKVVIAGIAGTFATDIWTFLLRLFGVHSHGLLLVGLWVKSHLPSVLQGQLAGKELLIGWTAHYLLGISFAFLLIPMYGKKWFRQPTAFSALVLALVTFVISLFIIQPMLNFGIAFSKFRTQPVILLKVLAFHLIYSLGVYAFLRALKKKNAPSNLECELQHGK
ncbi:glucan phosphoethanolaminetransferase (alkaline phosphatase superfamily) [Mucilaginibacter sp. SG538B]|uniref:DUF2938 family protein n=1 Tax=Mucilaginibacter sp. SG538B TaxID=2587021 RepID=UPI00159E7CCA|nr:DUF2938 family protein [Mucilaginibacter sp. SG538B]NVM66585.1 glucan phosphoethanolaminetransferase (alkaline phosphatase superfamily) [Mucilaginibacter sp. SG538B]